MSEGRQLSTFFVDDLCFGIDVQTVQEVIRRLVITRVPLSPVQVGGLINLRGQILTAIDLRRCLNLPQRPLCEFPVNLIIRTEDGLVSLLVDEIGDVVEPGKDMFEHPPSTLRGRLRDFVLEAYKLPSHLLLYLDTRRLLAGVSSGTLE